MNQISFKPFAGKGEKNLRGSKTVIDLFDSYFKATDKYLVDTLIDEEDETLGTKETLVDAVHIFPKSKINNLVYYYSNDQDGYFLQVNDMCWGFKDRMEGEIHFDTILKWLNK